jgi:hypothetical protein
MVAEGDLLLREDKDKMNEHIRKKHREYLGKSTSTVVHP